MEEQNEAAPAAALALLTHDQVRLPSQVTLESSEVTSETDVSATIHTPSVAGSMRRYTQSSEVRTVLFPGLRQ